MPPKSQVDEKKPPISLDAEHNLRVPLGSMAKKRKVPEQIKFKPDDREKKIIEAGQNKTGLKTAQDILSMALQHWARTEQLVG